MRAYADFWYREPHVYYFSDKTLSAVTTKAGLKGSIQTVQEYNFINQLNWILTGQPQKSADIGMSNPVLPMIDTTDPSLKKDLVEWLKTSNEGYINILNKHGVGENILFIGQKGE